MRYFVYFLINNSQVVYVGITKDVQRRICEHRLSDKSFLTHRAIEVESLEIAQNYERRWIKWFNPVYNRNATGRPSGPQKEPLNIYMRSDRAKRLREFAVKEQKTISIVVENALEQQYGI